LDSTTFDELERDGDIVDKHYSGEKTSLEIGVAETFGFGGTHWIRQLGEKR
jgi:hypothetical protein